MTPLFLAALAGTYFLGSRAVTTLLGGMVTNYTYRTRRSYAPDEGPLTPSKVIKIAKEGKGVGRQIYEALHFLGLHEGFDNSEMTITETEMDHLVRVLGNAQRSMELITEIRQYPEVVNAISSKLSSMASKRVLDVTMALDADPMGAVTVSAETGEKMFSQAIVAIIQSEKQARGWRYQLYGGVLLLQEELEKMRREGKFSS